MAQRETLRQPAPGAETGPAQRLRRAALELQAGRAAEAERLAREALAAAPAHRGALYLHGLALLTLGRAEEALTPLKTAAALGSDPAIETNLALALHATARTGQAIEWLRHAASRTPAFPPAFHKLGFLLHVTGEHEAAEATLRQAVELAPDFAEAHNDLAIVLRERGRLEEAVAHCREALARNPDYAEAYVNLGNALIDLGRPGEAEAAYRNAIERRPDYAEAYLNLANCFVADTAKAFECFTRHAELKYGGPGGRQGASAPPGAAKLKHDREQLDHMIESGIRPEEARAVRAALASGALAGDPFARLFHIEGGERLPASTIDSRNDPREIEARWTNSNPNIVVVDNLLTPEALAALRRFCWGSTIWRDEYRDGYLGAFPPDGFACPLMAQIADELRERFPAIFRSYPLMQTWAFKYDSELRGIRVHADFAAVNVNFWITPDEANLDPASGGLELWNVPAPLDWDFDKYNNDEAAIRQFLAESRATSVIVPYRANRAVVFDSDLFHKTDRIVFQEGYRNRRINITLLYGFRDK